MRNLEFGIDPARETETPPEKEAIGLEQVVADMATLMGGALKTMAETQRVMVPPKDEPAWSRGSESWHSIRVDRLDGATARLNKWSDSEKSLSCIAAMKGGAQRVVQHLSDAERSLYEHIVRVLDQRYASDDQAEKHAIVLAQRRQTPDESL